MKQRGKIYNFSDIKNVGLIPSIRGYLIIENFVIDNFFIKLRSHSTDVYDFRLIERDGEVTTLFYGMLQGENSNSTPEIADEVAGNELNTLLNDFASSAPKQARRTNKCVVYPDASSHASLIACECRTGTIIGGWHNSHGDKDIALQMLAYCMYAFGALNTVLGPKDLLLKEKSVDTIPNDSRFGKYRSTEAEQTFLAAICSRPNRMRNRALRKACPVS